MIAFYSVWSRKRVLIDTWWNVNSFFMGGGAGLINVLIDTWWNVNIFTKADSAKQYMF